MLKSKKVVVVDDDEKVIALIEKALIRNGFQVFSALEGQKALELVRKEKPQVLITDILLPGIDGVELCKAVKDDPETSDIKVILITGVYNEASFRLEMNCRADGFIEKPIDIKEFCRLVNEKMNQS
ncbi:MAG: response regulator [Candidatus Aminicenantes bacterium]|nr:response regulator [Candidatus Aminicenantes bacterium]NIM84981.1 response regulator [Candidatus Aminicenantes bacterium]NIN24495.1 response regulator [Candidatus Aminicenantes bacterium]NIN48259.1 response regulator [Candidatus Aminicenantes bacterium]NIN91162.1 response regulator [Candidatus Aminicenantes bacterium]